MTKCVFCGKEENFFIGVNLIKNDGTISYFCSSKCRKNALKLKRDKKKIRWTEAYRIARDKNVVEANRVKEVKEGKVEVSKDVKKEKKSNFRKTVSKN